MDKTIAEALAESDEDLVRLPETEELAQEASERSLAAAIDLKRLANWPARTVDPRAWRGEKKPLNKAAHAVLGRHLAWAKEMGVDPVLRSTTEVVRVEMEDEAARLATLESRDVLVAYLADSRRALGIAAQARYRTGDKSYGGTVWRLRRDVEVAYAALVEYDEGVKSAWERSDEEVKAAYATPGVDSDAAGDDGDADMETEDEMLWGED